MQFLLGKKTESQNQCYISDVSRTVDHDQIIKDRDTNVYLHINSISLAKTNFPKKIWPQRFIYLNYLNYAN